MAFIGRNPKWNSGEFTPQSADPSNPTEGQTFYSDGTARGEGLWVYKNGGWTQVGSENTDLATYGQFSAEDGSTTGFTNVSITSSSPIAGEASYSVGSFTASFPVLTLSERSLNKVNSMSLFYKMTSGTAKLLVKDNAANVLVEQEISSTEVQEVVLPYYVGSAVTTVQLEIQDVSSATGLVIDDVQFTDDAFTSKTFTTDTNWIEYTPTLNAGWGTVTSAKYHYKRVGNMLKGVVSFVAGTVATQRAAIPLPSGLTIDTTIYNGDRNDEIGRYHNAQGAAAAENGANNAAGGITVDPSVSITDVYAAATKVGSGTTFWRADNVNDFIASNTLFSAYFEVPITQWAAQTDILLSDTAGVENTYVAQIQNNGSASILSQTGAGGDFIQSVTRNSTGNVTVTWTPGFFTVAPAVDPTVLEENRNSFVPSGGLPSTTSVTILTKTTGGSSSDENFSIIVKRQGTDYRQPDAFVFTALNKVAIVKDVKSPGTDGGTFTSGAWQTRDLNTVEGDSEIVSLATNQFTLPSGKYTIEAEAAVGNVNRSQLRLRNITSSTTVSGLNLHTVSGSSEFTTTNSLKAAFTLTAAATFELQHQCQTTKATTGFGQSINSIFTVENEVYACVKITKLD